MKHDGSQIPSTVTKKHIQTSPSKKSNKNDNRKPQPTRPPGPNRQVVFAFFFQGDVLGEDASDSLRQLGALMISAWGVVALAKETWAPEALAARGGHGWPWVAKGKRGGKI